MITAIAGTNLDVSEVIEVTLTLQCGMYASDFPWNIATELES